MEPLELEYYLARYFNGPPSQKTCFKTSLDHLKTHHFIFTFKMV